jgi:hypothetical protein
MPASRENNELWSTGKLEGCLQAEEIMNCDPQGYSREACKQRK